MSELHELTALDQGAAVASGEISALELVEHYLNRIEQHSDRLGAFVTVTADRARAAGSRPVGEGPLAGVPTAIKDLNDTAGVRTSYGSAAFADNVPTVSDVLVRRIEAAGLISLGKTSTPEFGSPCYTEPDGQPAAVTPWDTSRMAGGSSGGAAAAVAAGLVALAQGSDGGGSIRIPASCCGLVGLKPSRGRISGAPRYAEVTGLATAGPITRTVHDAAAFLDVMAGRSVGDPFWAPASAQSFRSTCQQPPGRLRIARFVAPVITDTEVEPECVRAWQDASTLLESLGHDVVDIEMSLPPEAVRHFEVCWRVLTAMSVLRVPDRSLLRPLTRWLGEAGERVSAPEFADALVGMRQVAARVLESLASYDAVLTPTLASLPLPVGAIRNDDDPAADFEAQKRFTPFTSLWNVTGSPAISLPLHRAGRLPVGVMLAAAPAEEALLLRLAAQVEEAAPWPTSTPPGW